MLKKEEMTNPESCMSRARPDELVFVLLGRDAAAPAAIRSWAQERVRLEKNLPSDAQILEALDCADRMTHERVPIFFFGCVKIAGHYMWQPGPRSDDSHFDRKNPWGLKINNGLAKIGVYHKDGWTAISRSDYTIDRRPGSHATFIARGTLTLADVQKLAREYFPTVAERVGVESWK